MILQNSIYVTIYQTLKVKFLPLGVSGLLLISAAISPEIKSKITIFIVTSFQTDSIYIINLLVYIGCQQF